MKSKDYVKLGECLIEGVKKGLGVISPSEHMLSTMQGQLDSHKPDGRPIKWIKGGKLR